MSLNPTFLTLEEVLELHQEQIARYGGTLGIRDMGLLDSAVAAPSATFSGAYLHQDLAEMAAAYLFHIVMNHPFLDGNKRTGALAAYTFLQMNDVDFEPDENEFQEMTLACASGSATKQQVVEFFRRNMPPDAGTP